MARCKKHDRYSCSTCDDNAGQIGLDHNLDPTIGLGGGLSIDLSDGSLVVGGFDLDGQ